MRKYHHQRHFVSRFLQLPCLLVLLICFDRSESLFFGGGGPRKAIWNLIETLGGHKQEKPIHHYHMHYYPVPLPVFVPKHPPPLPPPPPQKIEIELSGLHGSSNSLHPEPSFGGSWPSVEEYGKPLEAPWTDNKYNLDTWHDSPPYIGEQKSYGSGWDSNDLLLDKEPGYNEAKAKGILLQVPLKQQIVLYQPPAKDTKQSLLSILFKKIRRINDALFHPEDEDCSDVKTHHHVHDDLPHVSNSVTYSHI